LALQQTNKTGLAGPKTVSERVKGICLWAFWALVCFIKHFTPTITSHLKIFLQIVVHSPRHSPFKSPKTRPNHDSVASWILLSHDSVVSLRLFCQRSPVLLIPLS
jgi:hypothetical protein